MLIRRLELFRFKSFLVPNIELIEIDFIAPIQNIIGTNGSGKTSLLREINPLPATRTDFGEDGYKRIWIEHNNVEYVLSSNFVNTSSPHSFCKDEVELNTSGTTAVQEELVAKELGYTKLVHEVTHGVHRLSMMPVGARKTFLLTIHPAQMKMLYDQYRIILTKLRASRDNLSMLHERRAALTTQMIDEALKVSLSEENDKLSHELGAIAQAIGQVSNQKRILQQQIASYTGSYTIRSDQQIKSTRYRLGRFGDIDRSIPTDMQKSYLDHDMSAAEARIKDLVVQIRTLTIEIDKYEEHIRQNDAQGAIGVLEETMAQLRTDIEVLSQTTVVEPFDHYILESIPGHLSRLTDMLAFFIGYTAPILSMRDVQTLSAKVAINGQRLHHIDRDVNTLTARLHHVGMNLSSQIIHNIPQGCHGCILFQKYDETVSRIQTEYDQIERQHRIATRTQKRLQYLVEERQKRLTIYNQATPQLKRLSDYLREYQFLMIPLKDVDILGVIRTNPTMLLIRIERHYQQSVDHFRLRDKKTELDRLMIDHQKLQAPTEFGREFLTKMVAEKYQELEQKQILHTDLDRAWRQDNAYRQHLIAYETERDTLYKERAVIETKIEQAHLQFDVDLCTRLLSSLDKAKLQTISRLSEIDQILREQAALSARLHQEVLANIEQITRNEQEYALIEEALSPVSGIPGRYMIQFINDLIRLANIFLSRVFAYPFEFLPVKEGNLFEYKFEMQVGDVPIPEIASGSEAQRKIAELAFNLALMVQLEQTHYGVYLDECDKDLDAYHKQRLLTFLQSLVDEGITSQLFMIHHNAVVYGGMSGSDITVLNDANIVLPEVYNQHVRIERY